MRPKVLHVLFLAAILSLGGNLCYGQKGTFDVDAYKSFLATHKHITGSQVLNEYPAPLFLKKVQKPFSSALFLDSVKIKFSLTQDEMDLLMENCFVVTERLSYTSLGGAYLDVWYADLPVFVTTDAILHAVHMSYDEVLKMTELYHILPKLETLLDNSHGQGMRALDARYGNNPAMKPMLEDVDVYLTVARRLLADSEISPFYKNSEGTISELMNLIKSEKPNQYPLLSSTPRILDFSQFTLRGHYTQSKNLARYFKAMMWLGRTEFMLTKPVQQGVPAQTDEDIRRQVIDAFLLCEAMSDQSASESLREIDDMITFLVGESDNVRAEHLDLLRYDTGFTTADELLDMLVCERFQQNLQTKSFAEQRINSQILMSDPGSPEQLKPPSAFLLLGQRFIIDSYVLGNVVYDKIIHDGRKVPRMLPSSLDALFALGNDAAAQLLQDELARYHYAPNLTALRYLIDSYGDDFWNASLYNTWLNAIRALNAPDDVEHFPAFMQTAAWWQEKMNTQLSSWAQLRHDNLLYGKQSYSGGITCSFPYGYVEPFPEFFARLGLFARAAEQKYDGIKLLSSVATYFRHMAVTMDTLQSIATKELAGLPLSDHEQGYLKKMLFAIGAGCAVSYDGWYPRLFFMRESIDPDFVIADVHTAPTDEFGNFVGWVMHAGTGKVNLGIVLAPTAEDEAIAFVGPMMTYHEHVTTNFKRLTDEEWKESLLKTSYPRPEWVNNYLADTKGRRMTPGPSLYTLVTSIGDGFEPLAAEAILYQNYPNPFTPTSSTLISFTLPSGAPTYAKLEIYDVTGKRIQTLIDQHIPSGTYFTRWNGKDTNGQEVSSGLYFYRLTVGNRTISKHMLLTK